MNEPAENREQISESIVEFHVFNVKGLRFVLKKKNTLNKFAFVASMAISLVASVFVLLLVPSKSYVFLTSCVSSVCTIYPNLLGFSLGGFALAVGFPNESLMYEQARLKKISLYQAVNAIFALTLLIQIYALVLAVSLDLSMRSGLTQIISISENLDYVINCIFIFLLLFGILYSLFLTPYLVINLFTLSQTNNAFYTARKFLAKPKVKSGLDEKSNEANLDEPIAPE